MTRITPLGSPRIGIVQYPASNCDRDCIEIFRDHLSVDVIPIWHGDSRLPPLDGLILPGGFSYGDYLRAGALAAHAPIHSAIRNFALSGGAILGVCNGFQILTEMKLLPGTLMPNRSGKFTCKQVNLSVPEGKSRIHQLLSHQLYKMPVAHGQGCYYIDEGGLARVIEEGQVLFRYCDGEGQVSDLACPNGSIHQIAGIMDPSGRIIGMMPHPERAVRPFSGSGDGLLILKMFLELAVSKS